MNFDALTRMDFAKLAFDIIKIDKNNLGNLFMRVDFPLFPLFKSNSTFVRVSDSGFLTATIPKMQGLFGKHEVISTNQPTSR